MTLAERIAARKPEPRRDDRPEWLRRGELGQNKAKDLSGANR